MSVQRAEREITALQQTIQRLEAELQQTTHRLEAEIAGARERVVQLTHYTKISREFGGQPSGASSESEETHKPNGANPRVPKGGMSGRAVQECIAILRERREHIPTQRLYELIQQRGIRLGGQSPVAALSGYLSRTPGVIADKMGRRGWGLEEWNS